MIKDANTPKNGEKSPNNALLPKRNMSTYISQILRSLLRIVGLLLLILLFAVVGSLVSLITETGRLFWLQQALPFLQNEKISVVVTDVRWPLLGELNVGYLQIAQGRSPLIEVTDAKLSIVISELWSKRLHVTRLSAGSLVVYQPASNAQKTEQESTPLTLKIPQLPPIKVDQLAVKKLLLRNVRWPKCRTCSDPQQHVGPGQLKVIGAASLHWPKPLELELTVTEKGHKAPLLWLAGESETNQSLAITGRIQQQAGGWLSQWLQLPKQQIVELALSVKAQQIDQQISLELEQLSAPLFKQNVKLQGKLHFWPARQQLDLEQLLVTINKQQHKVTGSISPAQVVLGLDIQRFDVGLFRPWVESLNGGEVSAKGKLAWDWNIQHLPQGNFIAKGKVRYQQQLISLNADVQSDIQQLSIKQLRARIDDTALSIKGRLKTQGQPLALTFTLTHLRDDLVRQFLPDTVREKIPEELSIHAQRVGGIVLGAIDNPRIMTDINILGRFDETPFTLYGSASGTKNRVNIGNLNAEISDANLEVAGFLDWVGNSTQLQGNLQHVDANLAYQFVPTLPTGVVGFLNAKWALSGNLKTPLVKLDASYQGGYEHNDQVLPFNLVLDTNAQLGTWQEIAFDVEQLNLSMFQRPLVTMKGRVNAKDNDLSILVSRLPTHLLEALGYPIGEGRAEARLRFGGSFAEPVLGGYISYAETLAVRSATDEREEVPLIWHANISSEKTDLIFDSSFTLDTQSAGLLSLSLPWHNYLNYLLTKTGGELPTNGTIQANLDASALQLFIDTDQMTLHGGLEADMTLSGTAAEPNLDGELLLTNGYFRHSSTGTILSDIQFYAQAQKQHIKLVTGYSRDGEGGEVKIGGYFDWKNLNSPSSIDLTAHFKDANLVNMPNVKGAVSGDLSLKGGRKLVDLTGKLTVQPLNISIDTTPAVSIPTIEVQELFKEEDDISEKSSVLPQVKMDVEVVIENQAFIRGRGLTTELEGIVLVTGTVVKPKIAGSFKTVRGEINLLQRPIKLNEGRATFSNNAFNFNIPATYKTTDTDISIVVSGNEETIDLDLSSVPSLPEEEILSRLLFGDSVRNISALQAISLAGAINTISNGSSFNLRDFTRDKLGFDSLSIDQESEENGGGINVGIGKYLNERVYLELEHSSNPAQPWQGNIKIDVTDELLINSTAASTGDGSISLEWRRDY